MASRNNPKTRGKIKLNENEKSIIRLVFQEHTNNEIAVELKMPINTVATYRTRILKKTGTKNTVGLIKYALRNGICTIKT